MQGVNSVKQNPFMQTQTKEYNSKMTYLLEISPALT